MTDVVRQLGDGKDYVFSDRCSGELKGIAEPAHLFELRPRDG